MGKIHICPKCGSTKMTLLYPDNNIWMCLDCGYKGKPITLDEKYLDVYLSSKELAARLR